MTSNGVSVQYWTYHEDKDPTIIMVHGFRGTHHGLERIVEQLPDFHVVVPDLPGFGASQQLTEKHSLQNYVGFLAEFREYLHGTSRSVVLGHSFGSIIAGHYAARYSEQLSKLILVNPIAAPALEGPRGVLTRLAVSYYWLGRQLPAGLSHRWLASRAIVKVMSVTLRKTTDRELRRYIDEQHFTHFSTFANPAQLAEAFDASVTHDISQVAADIVTPTLLVAGAEDDISPLVKVEKLHREIPDSTLVTVRDVGHLLHYEKPGETATAIRNFLV